MHTPPARPAPTYPIPRPRSGDDPRFSFGLAPRRRRRSRPPRLPAHRRRRRPGAPAAGPVHRHLPAEGSPVTIIDTALHDSLRALKLSGMLQTLDARLTQAHTGDLGHLEFLQVLCQYEITRRETTGMQRRPRRARFEQQTTLEEFDFSASPKLPAAQIRDLAARWPHAGESIVLYGPVGVGKSHVAQALGHLAIRQGADVRFAKTSRALADLAGGHADRTWPRRLAEL